MRLSLHKYKAIAFLFCLLLAGCKTEPSLKSPEQIFDECASGVVLIYCEYYYAITLPTGMTMYMTGINDKGEAENVTTNEALIKQICNRQFGTGFFIDSKGYIMTNRHVVDVSLNELEAQAKIVNALRQKRQAYIDSMQMARQAYAELQNKKEQCYQYDYYGNVYTDDQQLQQIEEAMSYVEAKYNSWQQLCEFINANSNPNAIKIRTYSKLGIAYNNTQVTNASDFLGGNACNIHKISKQENADLAIIQLKSKTTPEFAHIFDVTGMSTNDNESKTLGKNLKELFWGETTKENAAAEKLKIDQQLYMIGYNHGIELAQTKEGIKAQMTSGKITQLPDGERLLYSIPTMQGSSGSPVLDENGNLRGVNFAKATLNDDFNFGIPMNLILNFLKE